MEDRKAELLPVPYFHLVFTVPHDLNPLILAHKRPLLTLLFNAASQTLVQFGHRNLGGQIGCTMVLHTWDQTLGAHFHVHCIIAAGALAADGARWIEADPRFLFPVRALSTVFRGKFCAALAQAGSTAAAPRMEGLPALGTPEDFEQLRAQLYAKEWVVYAKAPLAGPAHVLDYVGRYTHRVAIANHRILDVRDGWVRFAYRNRRQGNRVQTMTLDADEFIRRFLLHVLPRGFMRLRHYGFLANRHKARTLRRCRDTAGPARRSTSTQPKERGAVDARGHGDRPHAMSALWRQATRTAPAAALSRHPLRAKACPGSPRALTRHNPARGGAVRLREG